MVHRIQPCLIAQVQPDHDQRAPYYGWEDQREKAGERIEIDCREETSKTCFVGDKKNG